MVRRTALRAMTACLALACLAFGLAGFAGSLPSRAIAQSSPRILTLSVVNAGQQRITVGYSSIQEGYQIGRNELTAGSTLRPEQPASLTNVGEATARQIAGSAEILCGLGSITILWVWAASSDTPSITIQNDNGCMAEVEQLSNIDNAARYQVSLE